MANGRVYPNEINRILYKPGGDVGKAVRRVALDIAAEAKRTALVVYGRHPSDAPRTGKLARSYRVEVIPGTNKFIVRNPVKYAAAMEFGAKPHEIRPRKKTYLRFIDRQGRARRAVIVHHPGSAARNTLATAARVVMARRFG